MNKLFKMVIGSHYFRVIRPNDQVRGILYALSNNFSVKGWVKEKGRMRMAITKRFMSTFKDGTEFRLHIGQLKPFLRELGERYISEDLYDVVKEDLYEPKNIKLPLNDGWVLRDYQNECKDFIHKEDPLSLHSKMVSMPTGTGKFHPLHTKVKVPGGWKCIGDMESGDEIIAKDGSITVVTGTYPQGIQDVYTLTFEDGRTNEAGLDHLWKAYYSEGGNTGKIVNTDEIKWLLDTDDFTGDVYIDLPNPESSPTVRLPIEPSILGNLLRVQSFEYILRVINADHPSVIEMIDGTSKGKIATILSNIFGTLFRRWFLFMVRTSISRSLSELGMSKLDSTNLFIPKMFLDGSTKQRFRLLEGMLSSHISKLRPVTTFVSLSKQLSLDMQYLVRSLGGICSIEELDVDDLYPVKKQYILSISKLNEKRFSLNKLLKVVSVEKTGREECVCISIGHLSSLYVADNFVVTHNTVTALVALSELNGPIVICVLPTYMEKWGKDCQEILDIDAKDIMMVRGGAQFKGLIQAAKDNPPDKKVYIISLKTVQNSVKELEQHNGDLEAVGLATPIEDMYKNLGIGTLLIDEVHQHLYAVYKLVTNANVPLVLGLSATLMSNDKTLDNIQRMMFPKELRFDKVKMKKYIKTVPISFDFRDFKKDRIMTNERGSTNYSHIAFERSILKNHRVSATYMNMISDILGVGYIDGYMEGDKAVIFAATTGMCDAIVTHLKSKYPTYDIRRYMEKDPYENAIESQIRVTTIQSLGTAIDVPGLRVTILTNSISSPVANLQVLGRLRELKDRDVKFFYIYSNQIPKQRAYHKDKLELFYDRVKDITELHYPKLI